MPYVPGLQPTVGKEELILRHNLKGQNEILLFCPISMPSTVRKKLLISGIIEINKTELSVN
jgi:hypothetical protein